MAVRPINIPQPIQTRGSGFRMPLIGDMSSESNFVKGTLDLGGILNLLGSLEARKEQKRQNEIQQRVLKGAEERIGLPRGFLSVVGEQTRDKILEQDAQGQLDKEKAGQFGESFGQVLRSLGQTGQQTGQALPPEQGVRVPERGVPQTTPQQDISGTENPLTNTENFGALDLSSLELIQSDPVQGFQQIQQSGQELSPFLNTLANMAEENPEGLLSIMDTPLVKNALTEIGKGLGPQDPETELREVGDKLFQIGQGPDGNPVAKEVPLPDFPEDPEVEVREVNDRLFALKTDKEGNVTAKQIDLPGTDLTQEQKIAQATDFAKSLDADTKKWFSVQDTEKKIKFMENPGKFSRDVAQFVANAKDRPDELRKEIQAAPHRKSFTQIMSILGTIVQNAKLLESGDVADNQTGPVNAIITSFGKMQAPNEAFMQGEVNFLREGAPAWEEFVNSIKKLRQGGVLSASTINSLIQSAVSTAEGYADRYKGVLKSKEAIAKEKGGIFMDEQGKRPSFQTGIPQEMDRIRDILGIVEQGQKADIENEETDKVDPKELDRIKKKVRQ